MSVRHGAICDWPSASSRAGVVERAVLARATWSRCFMKDMTYVSDRQTTVLLLDFRLWALSEYCDLLRWL